MGIEGTGIEGTDEVTTILRTTLRLFGVLVTSFCPFNAQLLRLPSLPIRRTGHY